MMDVSNMGNFQTFMSRRAMKIIEMIAGNTSLIEVMYVSEHFCYLEDHNFCKDHNECEDCHVK